MITARPTLGNEEIGRLPLSDLALPSTLPLKLLAPLGRSWWRRMQKAAKSKTYAAFGAVLGTALQKIW